ncbi:MAG TPA: CARDB domain-containing protein, partial [Solirubrobacteraceae bacterium]|nr:CARDB domain-containing protein [Solirubrobacteraceae bacterium]
RGYAPGTVADRTIKGGERYSGRRGVDGDDAILRYRIDTLDIVPPPPLPQPPPPPPPDTPPAAKPDLVVTALNQYEFTVKNQGGAAAGPFTVTLVGVGTQEFDGLAAGASATRTYNTSCEGGTGEARADSTNQVDESDEGNNVTTAGPYFC